jgi:hypothetical protein
MTKRWYQSRIIWLQIMTAVVAVLESQMGMVSELFGKYDLLVYLSAVVANVVLRFDTTQPMETPRFLRRT